MRNFTHVLQMKSERFLTFFSHNTFLFVDVYSKNKMAFHTNKKGPGKPAGKVHTGNFVSKTQCFHG